MTSDAGKSISYRAVQDYGKPEKQVSFFGLKMSYSRAFGIAFLVLFVLLFFPGFGVSSASVKAKKEVEQEGESLKEGKNTSHKEGFR
mgnify:CR=1 FL=1